MLAKKLSRRHLLRLAGAAMGGALLSACQPKVVEKVVEKEVTRVIQEVVKETIMVEGEAQVVEKEVTRVVEAAPQEVVEIEWATPAGLGLERTMYTNFAYRFMEENPGIKVNMTFESWGDHFTKLPTMLAGGLTPEVVHNHWTIAMDYANKGVFIDVMPYMERDGVDPDEFVPELLDEYAHGGKQYLLPKDSAINAVYLNLDRFEELGVELPPMDWTIDDYKTTVLRLTVDQDGRPATDPNFDAENIKYWGAKWEDPTMAGDQAAAFINALGTHWWDEDFQESYFDTDAVIEYWTMMRDLRCVLHGMPTGSEALGQGDQWRNAELCAMDIGHHATTFFAKQENVQFNFDIRPEPRGPFGQFGIAASSGFGVTTRGQNQEEGWKLLNFLTSEETQAWIGEQKRWGVQRKAIMDAINPTDGIPEHFADVHTAPWKADYDGPLKKIGMKAPVPMNRIKEIYVTEMDPIFTCGETDVAAAAQRVKEQVDAELAAVEW